MLNTNNQKGAKFHLKTCKKWPNGKQLNVSIIMQESENIHNLKVKYTCTMFDSNPKIN